MERTVELLTAAELAARLRVRPGTIQTWARHGLIPKVKLTAKVVRFDPEAVIEAITAHGRHASREPGPQHGGPATEAGRQ